MYELRKENALGMDDTACSKFALLDPAIRGDDKLLLFVLNLFLLVPMERHDARLAMELDTFHIVICTISRQPS